MNAYLWVGVGATVLLLLSIAVDGFDALDSIDALDFLDFDGWFSVSVVMAFVAAFGFVAGATVDPFGTGPAVGMGLVAGAAFGAGTAWLTRAAIGMPTGHTDTQADLLGSMGRVVTPIAPDQMGEVLLKRPHGPLKITARSALELPLGTEVVVVDVTSSTLVEVTAPGWDSRNLLPKETR